MIKEYFLKVDKLHRDKLYKEIAAKVGISIKDLIADESLTPRKNALVIETVEWAKQLRDDSLAYFTNNSLRMMTQGATIPQLEKEFNK